MKKSRRTYNGVHLNKKSNTQDVVEQSLTILVSTPLIPINTKSTSIDYQVIDILMRLP